MSLSSKNKVNTNPGNAFIRQIAKDFEQFKFEPGKTEHWSPRTSTITYNLAHSEDELRFGVLHELAHAKLGHTRYSSDFELLKMESSAWHEAARIGKKYKVRIPQDHIQNCLDTYRDWLHRRSTCPVCDAHALQIDSSRYRCFNCQNIWSVSTRRFVRPYRLSSGV